jgi:hypothetical protein
VQKRQGNCRKRQETTKGKGMTTQQVLTRTQPFRQGGSLWGGIQKSGKCAKKKTRVINVVNVTRAT